MSNKFSYSIIPFIAAGAACLTLVTEANAHGDEPHSDEPATVASASGLARLPDGSVNVPKQAQRRMEIRTLVAKEDEHPLTVELNGRVGIDPNAGGRVQAPFAGRIEPGTKGLPVAGQRVEKGQVLAHVRPVSSAVELGNQQAQLADIRANRKLAEQRVKRLESLEGAVPQKEIEAARAELSSLTGRERAVESSVGGSEAITASASGIIATANVLSGQIVEARDVLFEIVDPNKMVVEALTTDPSLANRVESAALANVTGVELGLLGGGRSLRDGALPLNFRAKVGNTPLAIGQPVTVVVRLNDKMKGIALPAEALVRNQANETIVWTKASVERFIPRPVEYKTLDAKTIVIVKGLTPENRVVVSGAALINQIR
ncbi:efflux RND transporter periplasmic adaptor subunit [Noviherbaspirillum autotrophicum]|uniref:Membrane protein n=1 Tax=Noviherbaspirillum autotrophicum TaxID=709839 RepID=A0A0C2BK38_9BURK|nr:efflux RND transporter periplasmic adaptor subunit [Noviherbaspirillum autotrophicum]KIF81600.1 membrane protein [Noviherbaspirillum autotrophicum]